MFKINKSQGKERGFSLIILPFSGKPTLHISISPIFIKLLPVLAVALLVLMLTWYNSYWHARKEAQEVTQLRRENEILTEEVEQMNMKTVQLKQQMEDVEELSEGIKNLLATETYEVEEDEVFSLLKNLSEGSEGGNKGGSETLPKELDIDPENFYDMLVEKEDKLKELKEDAKVYSDMLRATPSTWPAEGRVTSEYGLRSSPFTGVEEFHEGIDIAAPIGTEVQAPADGTVKRKRYDRGYGRKLIIEHGYDLKTMYAHLSDYKVEEGEEVQKGNIIGFIGSTGFSTGPHLHYEVHKEGKPQDPRLFLPER